MLQEQVQQYLKGTGLRTENLGLICLLEKTILSFFFFLSGWPLKLMVIRRTERVLLLGWGFSKSSFGVHVFKQGLARCFLKGLWLCRFLGRSPGFIVQMIYFLIILPWSVMKMYFIEVPLEFFFFKFHLSQENFIVKFYSMKV